MKEYIDNYNSIIGETQKGILNGFISNSKSLSLNEGDLTSLLSRIGSKIYSIPKDYKDPNEYNKAITAAITDLTALYKELDNIARAIESVNAINNAEISKLEQSLDHMERTVKNKLESNRSGYNYTDIVTETFSHDTCDDSMLPKGYPKLWNDQDTLSLRRPIAGDISRTISVGGRKLCSIKAEQMLGISTETRHGVEELVDGNYNTYWKETILSDSPIGANVETLGWLPPNYKGGACVKLRIDFDYITPINELSFKPLSPYPMKLLAIEWTTNTLNPKTTGSMIPINGNFADGLTGWTKTQSSASGYVATTAGMDGSQALRIDGYATTGCVDIRRNIYFVRNGVMTNLTKDMSHLLSFSALIKQTDPDTIVTLSLGAGLPAGGEVQLYSGDISNTNKYSKDWEFVDRFFRILSDTDYSYLWLNIKTYGTCSTTYIDNIQLSNDYYEQMLVDEDISGDKVISLNQSKGKNITAKTLWLTISQPHYMLKTYNIPESFLKDEELWNLILDRSETAAYSYSQERTVIKKQKSRTLPEDSEFNILINRLGGKVKELILGLYEIANPSDKMVQFTKYEYQMGGYELDLRYREYLKEGYWISKPVTVNGEIRELKLLPNSNISESQDLKFFISMNDQDILASANIMELTSPDYNMRLYAAGETGHDDWTAIHPKPVTDRFEGSDRYHKVKLSHYPYVNREKIASIQKTLDDNDYLNLFDYDPNLTTIIYTQEPIGTSGAWSPTGTYVFGDKVTYLNNIYSCTRYHTCTPATSSTYGPWVIATSYWQKVEGILKTINGYKPLDVVLKVGGKYILPDILGQSSNQLTKLISNETLSLETDGAIIKDTSESSTVEKSGGSSISRKLYEEKKLSSDSYVTKYPVEWDDISRKGHRLALYWHRVSAGTDTSEDILISPANYDIVQSGGHSPSDTSDSRSRYYGKTTIIMKDAGFSQIIKTTDDDEEEMYDLIAYYRTKVSAAGYIAGEEYMLETFQVSGLTPLLSQSYPVTRNMTDYVNRTAPTLKASNMDPRAGESYYPVYEYFVNEAGEVVFADDLFRFGDTKADITIRYETLDINPRIIVKMSSNLRDQVIAGTPILYDYTLLINARKQ